MWGRSGISPSEFGLGFDRHPGPDDSRIAPFTSGIVCSWSEQRTFGIGGQEDVADGLSAQTAATLACGAAAPKRAPAVAI
jgi:hypothetical protein